MNMNKILKTTVAAAVAAMLLAVPASAAYGNVTADLLTVRTGPSTDCEAVGMLSWGDSVYITYAPSSEWFEIYLDDGCYYVSSDYIFSSEYGTTGSGTDYDYGYNDTYSTDYGYTDYSSSGYDYNDYGSTDTTYEAPAEEATTSSGTYLGNFTLTAYCGCASCCGSSGGLTASGTVPTAGRTVAMGGVPFGTKLMINGNIYTVEDRGTSYGVVDIFMNSHSDALAFGMQSADVYQLN